MRYYIMVQICITHQIANFSDHSIKKPCIPTPRVHPSKNAKKQYISTNMILIITFLIDITATINHYSQYIR